jgi:hypothetical protein
MTNAIEVGELPPVNFTETVNLLASVGNHEAKALFLLYLAQDPTMRTKRQMRRGFSEFIGDGADWVPSHTSLEQYCDNSLGPIGSVVEGRVDNPRGLAKGFEISEYGLEIGVPTAGLLLDWTLRYPVIGLSTVFGATVSPSEKRAATTRINLFEKLTMTDEGELAVATVAHSGERDHHSVPTYKRKMDAAAYGIKSLIDAGIIQQESVYESNTSIIDIIDANPVVQHGPERTALTSAIYDYIHDVAGEGKSSFIYEDCFRYVQAKLSVTEPHATISSIRNGIASAFSMSDRIKGTRKRTTYNDGDMTKVTLRPEFIEPLREITSIVNGLAQRDTVLLAKGNQLAYAISNDTASKLAIMEKAQRFSSHVNALSVEVTMKQVLGILATSESPIAGTDLARRYREEYRRPFSQAALTDIMRRLVEKNEVAVERKQATDNHERTRNYYSVHTNDT